MLHYHHCALQPAELAALRAGGKGANVILDSKVKVDELRAIIKSSCLILEQGTDAKAILPGPLSCDYNSEDRSRVRKSKVWIRGGELEESSEDRGDRDAGLPHTGEEEVCSTAASSTR